MRDVRRIGAKYAKDVKDKKASPKGKKGSSAAREEAMATLAHEQVLPEVYISSHNLHVDSFGDISLQ